MKKSISLLLIVVLTLSMILTGCGGGGTEATGDATAAPAGETYTWKVQGYTAAGTYYDEMGAKFAEKVTSATNGQLTIEWYPADSIVATTEGGNAVRDGILDGVWDYAGLYTSLNDAFALFCSSPGLFSDPMDLYGWLRWGGGMELWQEMWDAYNMNGHIVMAGLHDQEDFLWSNKPIETIDDMKGLTLRMMPIMGTVLAENGLSVAFVSATEIVSSMERGVIDAGEYSIPVLDKTFGFQDVAKYYARPGFHQPTACQSLIVNKDKWNELPAHLQELVTLIGYEHAGYFVSKCTLDNIETLEWFDEIGAVQTTLTDETLATLQEWVNAWYDAEMPNNEWLTKVVTSQREYIDTIAEYKDWLVFDYPEWAFD